MANTTDPAAPKKRGRKAKAPARSWEEVISTEREEMSWEDIFDMYRLDRPKPPQGLVKLRGVGPSPKAEALQCKRCGVEFFSSHYFGGTPLCYAHRGGKDRDESV